MRKTTRALFGSWRTSTTHGQNKKLTSPLKGFIKLLILKTKKKNNQRDQKRKNNGYSTNKLIQHRRPFIF